MNRSMVCALALGVLLGAACKKSSDTAAKDKSTEAKPSPATPTAADKPANTDATASVGVQAGGIEHADNEGAAAILASMNGTVEVRRVGEPTWAAAKADTKLFPGDVVRTSDGATATVTLADESTVELAEATTLAIASRDGTADPASATAVLGGLARFSVTPRAPAEGPFRVYTSSGVIVTRGTVYGVGVSASGDARVGVESGTVEVVGLAQLDAPPVPVEKSMQVSLAADGKVGAPAAWPADDWGTWRDDADANVQLTAAVDAHGKAMADLNQQLLDGYAELQASADQAATFEASAAASADKNDTASYQSAQADGAATIDASFSLAARLEALTWAYGAHAELATDLYVRHPQDVETIWPVVAPRVDAAILWPKRYDVTAVAYLEPLRAQYYIHHPRGRMHAELVGVKVPDFYASVEPAPIDPVTVRGKVKGAVWIAPEMTYHASTRPVWIATPDASWHASVKAHAAPPRAKVGWYVRPPNLKAHAIVGTNVTGKWDNKLTVGPAQPVADLHAMWKVPVGTKIHVEAPDLHAAAAARAKVKLGTDGHIVWDRRAHASGGAKAGMAAAGNVKANAQGKVNVKVPDVHVKAPDVKADVSANVRDHRDATVNAGANAKAKVDGAVKANVKAPAIKVQAPSIKVEGKAKGSFKIGH
jgi:hypothetical protein